MIHFADPYLLIWLWVIPALLLVYSYWNKKQNKQAAVFAEAALLQRLLPQNTISRKRQRFILWLSAVTLLIVALSGPQWGFHLEEVKQHGVDVLIAVDVSKSMLAEDMSPNRLEWAKRKISDLLEIVQGDRIGLMAFAGTSFVQCPLTLDYGAIRLFLDYLNPDLIPVGGTNIADTIYTAKKSFLLGDRNSKALILLTDGENLEGDALIAAKEAAEAGIKIFTIGIGKPSGAPIPLPQGGFVKDPQGNVVISKLDESTLQHIAQVTGATYARSIASDQDLKIIYTQLKSKLKDQELKSGVRKRWEERFQILIGLALLLLTWEVIAAQFLNGADVRTRSVNKWALLALLSCNFLNPAGAVNWNTSFENGVNFYHQQKYDEALKYLQEAQIQAPQDSATALMLGNTYYQKKNYEEALKNFQNAYELGDSVTKQDALFNIGNTQFKMGNLEGAKNSYEQVLKLNRQYDKAKHMLRLVLKEIKRRLNENKKRQEKQEQQKQSPQDPNKQSKDNQNSSSTGTGTNTNTSTSSSTSASTQSQTNTSTSSKTSTGSSAQTSTNTNASTSANTSTSTAKNNTSMASGTATSTGTSTSTGGAAAAKNAPNHTPQKARLLDEKEVQRWLNSLKDDKQKFKHIWQQGQQAPKAVNQDW